MNLVHRIASSWFRRRGRCGGRLGTRTGRRGCRRWVRRGQHGVDHVDVGAACCVGACHPIAIDLDVPVFTGDDYGPTVLGRHLACDVGGADIAQHHVVEKRRQQHLRIGLERLEGGRVELGERGVGRREDDVGAAVEHADNVDIGI